MHFTIIFLCCLCSAQLWAQAPSHTQLWEQAKQAEAQNRFELAAELRVKAIQILEAQDSNALLLADYYSDLAYSYTIVRLNRPQQTLTNAQKAWALAQKHFEEGAVAQIKALNMLSTGFLMTNDFAQAERYNELMGSYLRRKGSTAKWQSYFMKKGNIANRREQSAEAIAAYEQALKFCKLETPKAIFEQSKIMGNIAIEYARLKNYPQAYALMQQKYVLNLQEFGLHHVSIVRTAARLSEYALALGQDDVALGHAKASLVAATLNLDSLPQPFDLERFLKEEEFSSALLKYYALSTYAEVKAASAFKSKQKTDLNEAIQVHRLLLTEAEQLLLSLSQDGDKSASFGRLDLVSNLRRTIALAKNSGEYPALELGFYAAELDKALILRSAFKGSKANNPLDTSLRKEQASLSQEQNRLDAALKQAVRKKDQEKVEQINNELLALDRRKQAFLKRLQTEHPRYYQEQYSIPIVQVDDLQAVLPPGAMVLLYSLDSTGGNVFCIDKTGFSLESIPMTRGKDLKNLVSELRLMLSDYAFIQSQPEVAKTRFVQAAKQAYTQLIPAKLAQRQDIKQLIIIPDGLLAYIPFEVFLKPEAHEGQDYAELPYLLKDYALSYSYSATLLRENILAQAERGKGSLSILGVAANYDNTGLSASTNRAPIQQQLRQSLNPLPQAEAEVRQIESRFKGQFLYGQQASESEFKALAPQFGILHLAMHGLVDNREPLLSSLAFTENGDSLNDNFLQAFEINELPLQAALVVLSACETGYGKLQAGEGVMSLARSFMVAGVPSVNMSLWQVNDLSTAQIMQGFYEGLNSGKNQAEALREAKLNFLQIQAGEIGAHPAFWAPFIQLGAWERLEVRNHWSPVLIGGLMTLAALGLGLWWYRRHVSKS